MRKYLIGTGLIIALVLLLQLVSCANDVRDPIDPTPYIFGTMLLVALLMAIVALIGIPVRYFKARAQRRRFEQAMKQAEDYRKTAGVPPLMTSCRACNGHAFIPDINGIPGWSVCFHCMGSGLEPLNYKDEPASTIS